MRMFAPVDARCDDSYLHVTLNDDRKIRAPLWWYPYLQNASADRRANMELLPTDVWWPDIDKGVSIKGLLLGWKAPGAMKPGTEPAKPSDPRAPMSTGVPVPDDWETENDFPEGACCPVDYRSLIHAKVRETYEFGARYVRDFDYDRFFAATDTLLDVGNILHSARVSKWPSDEVIGQLWMYGVLQALAVQQQAMRQLLRCFGLNQSDTLQEVLAHINELRIAVAGHPSDHNKNSLQHKGCTFLSHREHGSRTKFGVVTYKDFVKWSERTLDLPKLIDQQRIAIECILAHAWNLIQHDPKFDRSNYDSEQR